MGKGKGGKNGKGKGGKDGTEYYNFVPPQMLVVPPRLVDIGVDLQLAGGKLGPIISPSWLIRSIWHMNFVI